MKVSIDVANEAEGAAIACGLRDETVRAFVIIVGLLKPFDKPSRARILQQVADQFGMQLELLD